LQTSYFPALKPVFHLPSDLGNRLVYFPTPPFAERCVVSDSLHLCDQRGDGRIHIDALAKHSLSWFNAGIIWSRQPENRLPLFLRGG
jgi:hypothetical protein